ncbi:MAG: MnmC family methyltransferase [Proteobacteria bacterium]|nr:MnmC family methyltransferase [Pseudomonadota bacterium]
MDTKLATLIRTEDGTLTLSHPDYDEAFHSKQGARFEADSLYMGASNFRAALATTAIGTRLTVLDVGLGLGYNALMTIECWFLSEGRVDLHLISLEQSKELVDALAAKDCRWKDAWPESWLHWSLALSEAQFSRRQARFKHPMSDCELMWDVQIGDARKADLPSDALDFIWQDAFSHKKNPELWTPDWFNKLRQASRPGVCLVSYSVARLVRDHMHEAGWIAQRFKAPAASAESLVPIKKQWLLARLAESSSTT